MTVSHYRLALGRHRWAIVVLTLLGGAGALVFSLLQPPRFEASAQLVATSNVTATDAAQLSQGGNYVIQRVRSYALVATSDPVMSAVIAKLNLAERPDQLSEDIDAQAAPSTSVLTITAAARTPQQAQALAETTAEELQRFVYTSETPAGSTTAPVKLVISRQAVPPADRAARRTVSNVVLGLAAGLFVGVGAAVGSVALNRSVRDAEHAAVVAESPVLTVVPVGITAMTEAGSQPADVRQSFDKLLVNLRIRSFGRRMTSFAITSPAAQDGRTAVAVGLALAFALAGHPVLLIDGDGGSAAAALGIPDDKGLADVLLGRTPLEEVVHLWRPELPLHVLTCGAKAAEPGWLPDPAKVAKLLSAVHDARMVTVIDCPGVLPAREPPVLAASADAVLLAVRPMWTAYADVGAAVRELRAVRSEPVGVVVVEGPAVRRR